MPRISRPDPHGASPVAVDELARRLTALDGKPYGAYRQLRGSYDLGRCRLEVDHVQADPYAPPSLVRLVVGRARAGIPGDLVADRLGRIAVADFLTRRVREVLAAGEGSTAAAVSIGDPGQEILERTSVVIGPEVIEARLSVALPASGRRIRGREAAQILTETLPELATRALEHRSLDARALAGHVRLLRDQEHIRGQLASRGLVAFVADGAILARRSGDSDLPLTRGAVPFDSPASLRTAIDLPDGRMVTGMGIPEGITVIVGGGYHGKSTLLRALERGVYPHIGGDGRDGVITRADAAAIRAEDGRAVTDVDISAFLGHLPSGIDPHRFSTTNASGSTSQAANLVEALGAGASLLLIDEDTSATNFMIRDARMRELIPAAREPITPFMDRVRPLHEERGVSTILVTGGSGAFLEAADRVIAMDAYVPHDVTDRARRITERTPREHREQEDAGPTRPVFAERAPRRPAADALPPTAHRKPASARGRSTLRMGHERIDVSALAQLVDAEQCQGIAHALDRLADLFDGRVDLAAAIAVIERRIDEEGLDVLSPHRGHPGLYARPRALEIAAAVDRYRGLRMTETNERSGPGGP